MTEASAGLRKALARNAGVSKLTTEELLAQMSEEQKTALAASLAPPPAQAAAEAGSEPEAEAEEGEAEEEGKAKKKDKDYMGEDAKAKAATERAIAVMSSEHVAGRTKLAADLLANDKLSADEIITILSASAPATTADPEEAARAEMQAALQAAQNSQVEANDSGAPAAAAGSVWDKSYAKLGLIKPAA
jgi:hypothetical protein